MEIRTDRPLPKHTKYDWEECLAKVILENCIDSKYSKLQIKDKPDLQSEELNIGVEVTVSVPQVDREIERLASDISYNANANKLYCIDRIKQLNGKYESKYGIVTHPTKSHSFKPILNAINGKLKKINKGGYTEFKEMELYIRDDNLILEQELDMLYSMIEEIQNLYDRNFNKVFIYIPSYLITYTRNFKCKMININSSSAYNYSIKARDMVIEEEKRFTK